MEELDPKTPKEHLEALHRLVGVFEELWDELPDGNGDTGSPNEKNPTKTDMFIFIASCADCGKDTIKDDNEAKRLLNF